jgi:hypothetical protein
MTNKYKVLGAMLNLGEFTAEDLAAYSNVKLNTVRVVLGRNENLIEQVGLRDTGQRGGQFKVYRLKNDHVPDLLNQIRETYANLIPPQLKNTGDLKTEDTEPLSLLTAEDVLLHRYRDAETLEQKQRLFDLAEIRITSARFDVDLLSRQVSAEIAENLRTRLNSLDTLLDLCAQELAMASGGGVSAGYVIQLLKTVKRLADDFSRQGDSSEAAAILSRVVDSPVLEQAVIAGSHANALNPA